jgi:hypothetical protein
MPCPDSAASPHRLRRSAPPPIAAVAAAMAAAALAGCSVRVLSPSDDDALRETVATQAARIESLERRERELEAQLRTASGSEVRDAAIDAEAEAARPRLASVALGGSSCLRLRRDASPELLLHLEPRDGRGRFLQIVGTLEIEAALLAVGEDPRILGRWRYGPLAVRDAWRGTFSGGHYTFREDVSLPSDLPLPQEVAVLARFADAIDGATHELLRGVEVVDLSGETAAAATAEGAAAR